MAMSEMFWFGACGHVWDVRVHQGRCPECNPPAPLYDDARMEDVAKVDEPMTTLTIATQPHIDMPGCDILDWATAVFHDNQTDGGTVVVTPEMIRAGMLTCGCDTEDEAVAIYRAMHALAPVTEGERQAVKERDEARGRALILGEALHQSIANYDTLKATTNAALDLLGSEITRLHDILAQRPAPVVDAPKAVPNPFRDFPRDPRRIDP